MHPLVTREIEQLEGPSNERVNVRDELVGVVDQGEHRTVVVGVGVAVAQGGSRRTRKYVQQRQVAALGDIYHALEHSFQD